MVTASPTFKARIVAVLARFQGNILITVFCVSLITALELVYSSYVNESYVFGVSAFFRPSFWITTLLIFIVTFTGGVLFGTVISGIFMMSIFQIINFEYFGSYILPINFIQLLPDFLLIMSSLAEVLHEMIPILLAAGLIVVVAFAILIPLARTRVVLPRISVILLAVLVGDFAGQYAFITANKAKLGEPSFEALLPDTNNLGVFNAYKSARYLIVGILPDRLSGKSSAYPSLPEPERLASPDVNVVLILNESLRAESLSVLGYHLQTTPRLGKIEGLSGSTIYSAGTMTRTSWAGIIHRLKYPGIGSQFLSQSNCLFRLAKENGFKTHFIYAQDQEIADTLLPFMCSNFIDSVLASSDVPEEHQAFDESLAFNLQKIDFSDRNFILIGPKGAHSPYAEKSPESFKIFDTEYENAIHYSDHVVAEIIDLLRQKSTRPTYIIITSDHGQILKGEDERRGHGWFKGKVVKVPFLFLVLNGQASEEVMTEVAKVQSHFDMSSLLLGLMGYDVVVEHGPKKEIFINGSDLSGLAGQLRLVLDGNRLLSVDLINGVDQPPEIEEFMLAD